MKIEVQRETLAETSANPQAPAEVTKPEVEDRPFYIVPPPPIPGQTGWSIVPW
jgi:hypothetical protein